MTTALGRVETTGLRKVSKAIATMDRKILHARQLFNERLARAQAEYHAAVLRAAQDQANVELDTEIAVREATTETTEAHPSV